jgi:hypothetical protein
MLPTSHPEVLAEDWLPPVVLAREAEVLEVVRRLDPPAPHAAPPWMVAVVGTRGSGSSSVARRAARELVDRLRTAREGPLPRAIAVRTARCRGPHGVASELLRALDDGFDGRGFPLLELLAGFLRRLRRDGRPVVLVLDDVRSGGPDLGPVLRALGDPDRFLPEGEHGLPPIWIVLAGTADAVRHAEAALGGRWRIGPYVRLPPYSPRELRQLLSDRAERALGRAPPAELLDGCVERACADGGGAGRVIELLRRSLVVPGARRPGWVAALRGRLAPLPIEPRVVRAIEQAAQGSAARLGEVRRFEARLAREEGESPLPATTLWRRIVRLEQAGYVRRDVRPGGEGGTRSVLRVLAPVDEWVIAPVPPGTHRGSDGWSASSSVLEWAAREGSRPAAAPGNPDDAVG